MLPTGPLPVPGPLRSAKFNHGVFILENPPWPAQQLHADHPIPIYNLRLFQTLGMC
ncbi:hypothetical protein DSO57_1001676 [Entomophthora muscae]|uniref:Uncharacterized protein n=1 Tax=Entomophthora muscae TaxID=34485 RepID=A0ACC2TVY8_9FUNG|nr:hypothetical protein DSO57_1001676 [Entomophthora muscae]